MQGIEDRGRCRRSCDCDYGSGGRAVPPPGCKTFECRGVAMEIRRISRRLMRSSSDDSDEGEILLGVASAVAAAEQNPGVSAPVAARSIPGFVRPVEMDDLPQIAELHGRIMPRDGHLSPEELQADLSRLLLEHPWRN